MEKKTIKAKEERHRGMCVPVYKQPKMSNIKTQ